MRSSLGIRAPSGKVRFGGDSGATRERNMAERRGSASRGERGIVSSSSDRLVWSEGVARGCVTPAGFGPTGDRTPVREAWARPSPRLMCAELLVSTRALVQAGRVARPQSTSDSEPPSGCEGLGVLHTVASKAGLRAGSVAGWQRWPGLAAAVILCSGAQGHGRHILAAKAVGVEETTRKTSRSAPDASGVTTKGKS
jgi:hypothetical protein